MVFVGVSLGVVVFSFGVVVVVILVSSADGVVVDFSDDVVVVDFSDDDVESDGLEESHLPNADWHPFPQ